MAFLRRSLSSLNTILRSVPSARSPCLGPSSSLRLQKCPDIPNIFRRWLQSGADKSRIKFKPGGISKEAEEQAAEEISNSGLIAVSLSVLGLLGYHLVPNTIGQEWIRDIYHEYKHGIKTNVKDSTRNIIEEVMDDFKMTWDQKANIEFFPSVLMEAMTWGSLKMNSGMLIGYPMYLDVMCVEDVDKDKIRLGTESGLLSGPLGNTKWANDFINSFVMSKEAKKFVLARQIYWGEKNLPMVVSAQIAVVSLFAIASARWLNRRFDLHGKPKMHNILFLRLNNRGMRFLNYFVLATSYVLRNIIALGATVVSLLSFASCFLLVNSFMEFYEREEVKEEIFIRAKEEMRRVIGHRLEQLVAEVQEELKFSDREKQVSYPFLCRYFEPTVFGSIQSPVGAAIGLPIQFLWNEKKDVDLSKLNHLPINYPILVKGVKFKALESATEEQLEDLKESLLLTDKAKKFAIAMALIEVRSQKAVLKSTFVPIAMMMQCLLASQLNQKFGLLKRPSHLRYAFYAVIGSLVSMSVLTMYLALENDTIEQQVSEIIKLGQDYREGCMEYLEKKEISGKLLHKVMKYGDYYFEEDGRLTPFFFEVIQPTLSEQKLKWQEAWKSEN